MLERLFGPDFKVLTSKIWDAYPAFNPPEQFAPFNLQPGLCYANTIENAASAMEMAAISGKNCALMVHAQVGIVDGKSVRKCETWEKRDGRLHGVRVCS